MPKDHIESKKNLISERLKQARNAAGLSQRDLARKLQLLGCDIDRNVITRIETNQRLVKDLELQAFSKVLHVSYNYLIDGTDENDCKKRDFRHMKE